MASAAEMEKYCLLREREELKEVDRCLLSYTAIAFTLHCWTGKATEAASSYSEGNAETLRSHNRNFWM